MSRIEIEHLLEQAVADALGISLDHKDSASRRGHAIVLKPSRLHQRVA